MGLNVVSVVDRRPSAASRQMRKAGFTVTEAFTTDQAVALCVSRKVDCVVLDQELFVEVDGWSVAQSVKVVRPAARVVLVSRALRLSSKLPKGVDAVVSSSQSAQVVETVRRLTHRP